MFTEDIWPRSRVFEWAIPSEKPAYLGEWGDLTASRWISESDISHRSETASLAVDSDSTRSDSFPFSNQRENTVERTWSCGTQWHRRTFLRTVRHAGTLWCSEVLQHWTAYIASFYLWRTKFGTFNKNVRSVHNQIHLVDPSLHSPVKILSHILNLEVSQSYGILQSDNSP